MVTRKENAIFICQSGGLEAALAVLKAHPESVKAVQTTLDFFSRLAAHEACIQPLVDAGIIETVSQLLAKFADHPQIASACILTLGRLGISAENIARIAEAGGLTAALQVLLANPQNADLAKKTLLFLETAALLPENVELLRKAGAADAILKLIAAHPDDAELQSVAARLLAKLAGALQVSDAVNGLQGLARILQSNPSLAATHIDNLVTAVELLSNLALVEGNIQSLHESKAIGTLIDVLASISKMTPTDKTLAIVTSAAAALSRLAIDEASCIAVVTSGALRQILATTAGNLENEELVLSALILAANCAAVSQNVARMISDGTINDVIALAKAHPLNEKILAAAVKTLALLATSEEAIRRMIEAGAAEIVVESVLAHMDNIAELSVALGLLSTLAVDEESVYKLLAAGSIDAIIEAMRTHHDKPEILTLCIGALCALLINEDVAKQIGEKGAIPLAVKSLRDHYANEGLCEVVIVLLESLASLPANAQQMLDRQLGLVDLINWLLTTYPDNATIIDSGKKLLSTLAEIVAEQERKRALPIVADNVILDELKTDALMAGFLQPEGKQVEFMHDVFQLAQNASNAQLMVSRGGLQSLASVLLDCGDDDSLFYAASSAFLSLAEAAGDSQLFEEPQLLQALCAMMKASETHRTPMELADLTKVISTVAKMKFKPELVQELLKHEPISSLFNILFKSDDPMLLAQACRLLGKLSNNEEAVSLMAQLANLAELIASMRRHMNNEEYLKYAVYLLGNLAVNDDLKNAIGREGGIQVILQAVDKHLGSQGLIENAMYALAGLSFGSAVNVSFIVACQGIELILSAMTRHGTSAELLESAVSTLCNLCYGNDQYKDMIAKSNGVNGIVEAVRNNFSSLDLLMTCFRTLGNLAYNPKNISIIVKSGAVQGIVAGMTVHSDSSDLIDVAIRVIANLAAGLDAESAAIMLEEGAVRAIVEAALRFSANLDLEFAALGCLCNLARDPNAQAVIAQQGGLKAVIDALTQLDFDVTLVDVAVRLVAMLSHNPMQQAGILASNVLTNVVTALRKHAANPSILATGLALITNLACDEAAAFHIANSGVVAWIISLLQSDRNEAIVAEALKSLSAICRSERASVSMAELALKTLVGLLSTFAMSPRVVQYSFIFLSNLCVASGAAEMVPSSGVVAAVKHLVVNVYRADVGAMVRGLKALENIAYGPREVREHMRKEGIETMAQELETSPSSREEVKRGANLLLAAMSRADGPSASAQALLRDKERKEFRSARDIFGDSDRKQTGPLAELPQAVRNMLLAGSLFIKHSNTAAPRPRHIYVSDDLKFLVWKDPKKPVDPKHKMKVFKIRSIERGRCTPQLQRKKVIGGYYAKEECAFAILGRERSVDLEASSEAEREKWIEAILQLVEYTKQIKIESTKFAK